MLYDRKRWEPKIPIVKPVKPRAKPKPLEPWQQLLRKAALYIKKHGWVRGTMEDGAGRVCAMGAIRRASMANAFSSLDVSQAQKRLEQHVGAYAVSYWNDKIARSANQVIRTLRAAARKGA